ncbi:MAG TPA: methionyl-tRNA formyltransferase, partial [Methanocorpusculum sp.]|nr:methionyl-tRNA formyltransferase [Methanocorpusculum sp.]
MRVIFMGTPEYAIRSLEAVYAEHEVVAVLTRADKPNKRGNKIQFSPVKEFALAHNIPVFQPENFR